MPIPDEYRRYAEHCADIAQRATNRQEADALLAMARVWTKLARDEERLADLVRDADAGFAPGEGEVSGRPTAFWEADLRFH